MICKCMTCGYDYTYKQLFGTQIGANGNNNFQGKCFQKYLGCGKTTSYVESVVVGDTTYICGE